MYVCIYVHNHENNVTYRLSPQWLYCNSYTSATHALTSCAQVYDLPSSYSGDNRESTLFSSLHICYPHLDFVRFGHSLCQGFVQAILMSGGQYKKLNLQTKFETHFS